MGLMIHCGAQHATLDQVQAVQTPPVFEATGHTPIPHMLIRDGMISSLEKFWPEVEVIEEAHALQHDGSTYFGFARLAERVVTDTTQFAGQVARPQSTERTITLGWRNFHGVRQDDGTLAHSGSAGAVAGSHTIVCDNLVFTGDVRWATVHSRFILRRMSRLIEGTIPRLQQFAVDQDVRHDAYSSRFLSYEEGNDLIVRAVKAGVVAPSKILKVEAEWEKPSHEEHLDFATGRRTLNTLQQAFTETLKDYRIPVQVDRGIVLTGVLDNVVGIHRQQHEVISNN